MIITRLLFVLDLWDGRPTCRKSSSGGVGLDLGPLLQGQASIDKLKSAYNLLIIGPRGLGGYTNIYKIMGLEPSGVVTFDLGPILQGQTSIAKLKSGYNSLIIGPRSLGW